MKLGLALGGGGAKGSYQVGVLRALNEHNLLKNLKVVAGTSIGAINACMVMERLSYEEMLDIWMQMENKEIYTGLERFKDDGLGLFNQRHMYNKLVELQDRDAIINSDIKGLVVASLIKDVTLLKQAYKNNLEKKIFHLNEMNDPHLAVLASASIPVLFGPTKIDDEYYVDGGLVDNVPLDLLINEGCELIFVIGLNNNLNLSAYDNYKIIDFSPKNKLSKTVLGTLNFSSDAILSKIERGYLDAMALIEELELNEKNILNL